jgi:hypothetical protein
MKDLSCNWQRATCRIIFLAQIERWTRIKGRPLVQKFEPHKFASDFHHKPARNLPCSQSLTSLVTMHSPAAVAKGQIISFNPNVSDRAKVGIFFLNRLSRRRWFNPVLFTVYDIPYYLTNNIDVFRMMFWNPVSSLSS